MPIRKLASCNMSQSTVSSPTKHNCQTKLSQQKFVCILVNKKFVQHPGGKPPPLHADTRLREGCSYDGYKTLLQKYGKVRPSEGLELAGESSRCAGRCPPALCWTHICSSTVLLQHFTYKRAVASKMVNRVRSHALGEDSSGDSSGHEVRHWVVSAHAHALVRLHLLLGGRHVSVHGVEGALPLVLPQHLLHLLQPRSLLPHRLNGDSVTYQFWNSLTLEQLQIFSTKHQS